MKLNRSFWAKVDLSRHPCGGGSVHIEMTPRANKELLSGSRVLRLTVLTNAGKGMQSALQEAIIPRGDVVHGNVHLLKAAAEVQAPPVRPVLWVGEVGLHVWGDLLKAFPPIREREVRIRVVNHLAHRAGGSSQVLCRLSPALAQPLPLQLTGHHQQHVADEPAPL